jgi:hypothetical protein
MKSPFRFWSVLNFLTLGRFARKGPKFPRKRQLKWEPLEARHLLASTVFDVGFFADYHVDVAAEVSLDHSRREQNGIGLEGEGPGV